ncbi:MAG: CrcB family protein [Actinomycetaceae bacterium]|nr:CrcB family protein [Actinomycetaceae bacterium]
MTFLSVLAVGFSGSVGATCRFALEYGVKLLLLKHRKNHFWTNSAIPIAVVNIIGCFLMGMASAYFGTDTTPAHLAVTTGFLGGFTTFSTAMLDGVKLARSGKVPTALIMIIGTLVLSLLAVIGGYQVVA